MKRNADGDHSDGAPSSPAAPREEQTSPAKPADDGSSIGPPRPVKRPKKAAVPFLKLYEQRLPSAEMYEKSYMHRETVTHIAVTSSGYVVTASADGHVKFWRKQPVGVDFVKHFRAHLQPIVAVSASADGQTLATASLDKSFKIFDVLNWDMVDMYTLPYVPASCCWVGHTGTFLAVSDSESPVVHVYDVAHIEVDKQKAAIPMHTFKLHKTPVHIIRYNGKFNTVITADKSGMIEYWDPQTLQFPEAAVKFRYKMDTDLFAFVEARTHAVSLNVSPDGLKFATMGRDRHVRVFGFRTGKIQREYDESVAACNDLHARSDAASPFHLESIDFGKRMAVEREVDAKDVASDVVIDESGHFALYGTVFGVKVVNLAENRVARVLGRVESSTRFTTLALYQGTSEGDLATGTRNRAAEPDPTLFCAAYSKARFYMFTRREPAEPEEGNIEETGRDVFNEKPTEAALKALTTSLPSSRLARSAVIHTTLGDIHLRLFPNECPKTVENFTVHSKNGYYNGVIFHRVIKGFMIQTGDPRGDGTGGESIWGGEFEDEFTRTLRHDRPFTLSMANAGPNTNGSQFFITTVPLPRLDNKHTVFGRVVKGQEVVTQIECTRTDSNDKPYNDIKIVNIDTSAEEAATGDSPASAAAPASS
eukprot:m51a1_g629 putative peptidylprolyl isomerase domain and wd repeat-containing protein 1-like (649) ;mRNA; r:144654-147099